MAETASDELVDGAIQLGEDYDQDTLQLTYRKNAQQALLFCSKTVALKNQNFYTGPGTTPMSLPTKGYAAESAKGPGRSWLSGYKNIVPVVSGTKFPADSSVSLLATRSIIANQFFTFELTSVQMAALVPEIRIYKVDYEIDPKTKEIITKNPTKREIVFNKSVTQGEIQIMEAYGGNLGSAGIESFSWALKGVNPAEVDSNIEASLKIYFNNLASFQSILDYQREHAVGTAAEVVGTDLPASFLDLITFSPPTELNTNLPCIDKYEPEFFEVLVEVGWTYSGASGLFKDHEKLALDSMKETLYLTLTDHAFDFREDGSATLEVNYRARTTFNTAKYDILGYSKDKKIKKEMDQLETSSEELDEDGLAESKKEEIQEQMKKTEYTLQHLTRTKTRELMKALICSAYTAKIPKALMFHFDTAGGESIVTNVSDMLAAAADPELGDATGFDTLRQQVVDDYDKATASATSISVERVSQKYLEDDSADWNATTSGLGAGGGAAEGTGGFNPLKNIHGLDNKKFGRLSEKTKLKLQGATTEPGQENGYFSIDFVYLGDILEVFFQTAPILTLLNEQKLAILLTDVAFLNTFELLSKIELRNKKYEINTGGQFIPYSALKCATNNAGPAFRRSLYHEINLANMPINLEILLDFLTDKIVKNNKTVYYLDDFVSDLFNELVKPLIADTGVMGVPMNQPAMINISLDTIKESPVFPDFYKHLRPTTGQGDRVGYYRQTRNAPTAGDPVRRMGAGFSLSNATHVVSPQSAPTENQPGNGPYGYAQIGYLDNYLEQTNPPGELMLNPIFPSSTDVTKQATVKIYGMISQAQAFKGDYLKNQEYNIYNFVVGIDAGLVKAVKFERVDQEYLREARVSKSRSFGAGQLRELYHVNLTLYGNNLLKPGGLIYVEPNPIMFGRPTEEHSIARVLGLGGYHLVVDVSHNISKDGWETQVKAMHISMPISNPAESPPGN